MGKRFTELSRTVERLEKDIEQLRNSNETLLNMVDVLKWDNARLREGKFTEEEFQNLCHNIPVHMGPDAWIRFKEGCKEYQAKLFGEKQVEEKEDKVSEEDYKPLLTEEQAEKAIEDGWGFKESRE